ncbi:MAG: hypothetical protein ACYDHZ_08000 [Dehalococcoidia bacterium]
MTSTDITSIIAIIVAFIALAWSVYQWIIARRPYLGIVSLDWSSIDPDIMDFYDSVKCTIKNVGQAPAKAIKFEGMITVDAKSKMFNKTVGVLLPTQEMAIDIAFSSEANISYIDSGYGTLEIRASITYHGVLPCKVYMTKQNAGLSYSPTRSFFLPGGDIK